MKRLTKKQNWFKQQNLTQKDEAYVGLDVHKKSISVAIWLNGQMELTFTASANYARLIKQLQPLKKAVKLIVYEAGPTGYGLARTLEQAKLPVQVISPANTLGLPNVAVKRIVWIAANWPNSPPKDY